MKEKILIALFMICLIVPSIIYPFTKQWLDTTNYENRALHSYPELDYQTINNYPTLYENYFNDHLPFKNELIKLKSLFEYRYLHRLENNNVILGKDDWLFYCGENKIAIEDYKAISLYTDTQLESILNHVIDYRDALKKQTDCEFVLMLLPDKEHLYSEYLPNYLTAYSSFKRIDQVYNYIKTNSDIKVCYPYKELMEAKEKSQVYYRYDTHWNDIGAYIGMKSLLETLHIQVPNTYTIHKDQIYYGDLAKLSYLSSYLTHEWSYSIEDDTKDISIEKVSNEHDVDTFKSTNLNQKHLYFIGDSFRTAMMPYLSRYFETSSFVHKGSFEKNDLIQKQPTVVVYELVERYLPLLETLTY